MAAKKKEEKVEVSLSSDNPEEPRPRLFQLSIKNFRCIGSTPVVIDLDDIVVLVGPNNVGKSSILKAYEVVMSQGSKNSELKIEDFPEGKYNPEKIPEIQLITVVYIDPGERWIGKNEYGENIVKERWIWNAPGAPERQGFDFLEGNWSKNVPWGAPNVANSRRPEPHRVSAFDSPEKQADELKKLLLSVLTDRVKALKSQPDGETDYHSLLAQIKHFQLKIVNESKTEIEKVQADLSTIFNKVFPGHEIRFDARPEDELDKCINFFKSESQLLVGPTQGYFGSVEQQGSGARRTILWAALKIICDAALSGSGKGGNRRPHVLLLDEPEICLHPSAIRDACELLYGLPETGSWQVMITTHSPIFIDVSRDNTTIVRVERRNNGDIAGTTIFKPAKVMLDEDDRARLKLLNIFDPYVAEFFFGGKTIVVEGDTEYTAFKHIVASNPSKYSDVHIVRARGKATIVSLCKILNHFGSSYSVLHDSDHPKVKSKKDGKERANPAWSTNRLIREVVKAKPSHSQVRLLASLPNFEAAYFQEEVDVEKPYSALMSIQTDSVKRMQIENLLECLIDHSVPPPRNCSEWSELENLEEKLKETLLRSQREMSPAKDQEVAR